MAPEKSEKSQVKKKLIRGRATYTRNGDFCSRLAILRRKIPAPEFGGKAGFIPNFLEWERNEGGVNTNGPAPNWLSCYTFQKACERRVFNLSREAT